MIHADWPWFDVQENSAEEKAALLRRHLEQGEAVSKLCEDQGLRLTVFCRWKWP